MYSITACAGYANMADTGKSAFVPAPCPTGGCFALKLEIGIVLRVEVGTVIGGILANRISVRRTIRPVPGKVRRHGCVGS